LKERATRLKAGWRSR